MQGILTFYRELFLSFYHHHHRHDDNHEKDFKRDKSCKDFGNCDGRLHHLLASLLCHEHHWFDHLSSSTSSDQLAASISLVKLFWFIQNSLANLDKLSIVIMMTNNLQLVSAPPASLSPISPLQFSLGLGGSIQGQLIIIWWVNSRSV